LLEQKRFDFRPFRGQKQLDSVTKQLYLEIKRKVFIGLDHLNKPGRLAAWLVLLGIDVEEP
jgi:hypothetical protein